MPDTDSPSNWGRLLRYMEESSAVQYEQWGIISDEFIARALEGDVTLNELEELAAAAKRHPSLRALLSELADPELLKQLGIKRDFSLLFVWFKRGAMLAAALLLATGFVYFGRRAAVNNDTRFTAIERTIATLNRPGGSSRLTVVENEVAALKRSAPPDALPVGTVVMWWGDVKDIPPGWELCDGGKVATDGPLSQQTKPDFVDRFPKGAVRTRSTAANLIAMGKGGNHNLPAHRHSLIDVQTDIGGRHTHEALTVDEATKGFDFSYNITRGRSSEPRKIPLGGPEAGDHSHSVRGIAGRSGAIDGDGGDTTGANQPAYSEVFFIIKVK
jgi:hypothetical protein